MNKLLFFYIFICSSFFNGTFCCFKNEVVPTGILQAKKLTVAGLIKNPEKVRICKCPYRRCREECLHSDYEIDGNIVSIRRIGGWSNQYIIVRSYKGAFGYNRCFPCCSDRYEQFVLIEKGDEFVRIGEAKTLLAKRKEFKLCSFDRDRVLDMMDGKINRTHSKR